MGGVFGQYAYRITNKIMFHSVPYFRMEKDHLESVEYNKLGAPASAGCVRMSVLDAKWIYENCPTGTLVTIYDSEYPGPLGKPSSEMLDVNDERAGWDPTDPDMENPWYDGKIRLFGTEDRILELGCTYLPSAGVLALDGQNQDISDSVKVYGEVDIQKVGDYPVVFVATDAEGNTGVRTGVFHVREAISIDKKPPTIQETEVRSIPGGTPEEIQQQLADIIDIEDESGIEDTIISYVRVGEGYYSVMVSAKDTYGNVATVFFDDIRIEHVIE